MKEKIIDAFWVAVLLFLAVGCAAVVFICLAVR